LRFLIVHYPSQFNSTLLYLIIMNIFKDNLSLKT